VNKLLLCTDLDRTLIPNGEQPESKNARARFTQLMQHPEVTLAYVSGRHLALIEEAIKTFELPIPDFAIADVGSTIYQHAEEGWKRWQKWDEEIVSDWQGHAAYKLHSLLTDIPDLQLQEQEKQNTHKLSYYLPLQADQKSIITEIDRRLTERGIKANLIWSIDELQNIGLLDILPASANKQHAITFLIEQCDFDMQQTLFAGDSGNDLDVLLSPVPSVLVANADKEVRAAGATASSDNLDIAQGGFLAMNGNYSSGILEGIAHYHPEYLPLIEATT